MIIHGGLWKKIAAMELHTVDGRHPAPPGIYQTTLNNGINYQHQLVSRISSINSISNFFTSGVCNLLVDVDGFRREIESPMKFFF